MKLKISSFVFATILAGSLSVCASSEKSQYLRDSLSKETNMEAKAYDRTFIDEMTEHHKEGVMMAEIAAKKAHHPELRKMAMMMMKDQSEEIKLMKSWRIAWYPQASDFQSHSVGMRMEKLESLSGEEFDIAFIDSMIMHHSGAIYLGHEAQGRGYHRSLVSLGKKISMAQIKELNQLRTWRYSWTNQDSER